MHSFYKGSDYASNAGFYVVYLRASQYTSDNVLLFRTTSLPLALQAVNHLNGGPAEFPVGIEELK